MKTERELIQQLKGRAEFCRDRGEVKTPELLERAVKALEQREGYKLVPVEPSADLVNHGHQVFLGHFNEGGQTGGRSLYFAYKAMIEAQENKG